MITLLLLLLSLIAAGFAANPNPGMCTNYTYQNQVHKACFQLRELPDCKVEATVSVDNKNVWSTQLVADGDVCQALDLSKLPYLPSGETCNICLKSRNNDASQETCFSGELQCEPFPFPFNPQSEYCVPNSVFAGIFSCKEVSCPSGCSGHGTCQSNGTCRCNPGYFGASCNTQSPTYYKCLSPADSAFSGVNVCTQLSLELDTCTVNATITSSLVPKPIYNVSTNVGEIRNLFDNRCTNDVFGCKFCVDWSDVKITPERLYACPKLVTQCNGKTVGPARDYPCVDSNTIDFFWDTSKLTKCLGSCANDCNFRGACVNGKCQCSPGFTGDDCSNENKCSTSCHYGSCDSSQTPAVCVCNVGWTGSDCNTVVNSNGGQSTSGSSGGDDNSDNGDDKEETRHERTATFAIISVVILCGMAGCVALAFYYFRRPKHNFNEMACESDDEMGGVIGELDDEDAVSIE